MKRFYFKSLLMMFVFAIALAFSGNCYAAVTFQADGGKDFVDRKSTRLNSSHD